MLALTQIRSPLRKHEIRFLREGHILVRDSGTALLLVWLLSPPGKEPA